MSKYSEEIKIVARSLYIKAWTPKEIQKELNLPNPRIIYYWAEKYGWAELMNSYTAEESIARRIAVLTPKGDKKENDINELNMLIGRHIEILSKQQKHKENLAKITAGDSNGSYSVKSHHLGNEHNPRKNNKKSGKNDLSAITPEQWDALLNTLYSFQRHAVNNKHYKTRFILKGRQEGFTYAFAIEALHDAATTGDSQIFISASKRQVAIFRSYITKISLKHFNVELKGNPIRLSNGAEFHFLSTNSNTAQSNSGHLYVDEVFWIPKFDKLDEVASPITTHDHWRLTYFSTPSTKLHPAYKKWAGDEWKGNDPKRKNIEFPTFDEMRDGGRFCPDQIWRYIITMQDAVDQGFDLVTISKLRERYSEDSFNMLFMCIFIDDANSVFKFKDLEKCITDKTRWQDFNKDNVRPFGNREVWGGYDPSRTTDNATFVVVAPPIHEDEKFRVLEIYKWHGVNFKYQAEQIKKIKAKYNMPYIGVDITGIGRGVYELIQEFAIREAKAIHYSVESKNRLVLKMIDVVTSHRIEWDEENKDLPASFLAIKQTSTASGNAITFVAARTDNTGHADEFFSIAHAVDNEPINFSKKQQSTWVM